MRKYRAKIILIAAAVLLAVYFLLALSLAILVQFENELVLLFRCQPVPAIVLLEGFVRLQ